MPTTTLWPGYNCSPDHSHQTIEIANMQADEYDAFMTDPSDYMFRIHMSRVSKNLAGLAKLPKLSDLQGSMGAQRLAMAITEPETAQAF